MILAITLNPAIDRVYFLDQLEIGEVNRPKSMTYTAGGKGLNVARVLKIMGESVSAGGFVGGYNGKFITDSIKKLGITDRFIQIDDETRICLNMTDRKTGKSTEILEGGPTVSKEDCERFLNQYCEDLKTCDLVTISGSMPKGVPTDFYGELIYIANEQGIKTIVDTSGESLEIAIDAKPTMVKPNKYELSKYLKQEIKTIPEIASALVRLKDSGIELPCVSLGKDGAIVHLSDGVYWFVSPDIPVVNTVGSGDSFIAGAALGIVRKMSEVDTIKMAMACATANTQFEKTGMVSKELVENYFNQIKYEKL